ncbi:hypothetical protein ACLQ25_09555 [Micromonospora sp. DT44]|uniref:hypothetical protein n=1 Tax=Micromonospora sp. DT44 TaxID=3393439 RepID=UPI003CF9C837
MASLTSPLGLPAAAKPRVDTQPPSVDSYGPEAIELMCRAGQPLDPWQEDSITAMLAVRADGKWACFEFCEFVPRQNGKGGVLEARALTGLLLLGERLIMWSAHEYKTAMEAFRRVVWLLGRLGTKLNDNLYDVDGILIKVINTNGEESLERLDTGARIRFVARSKGSGRGFSGDVNLIDEAFAYTSVHQAALMPTMSARPNPQVVYTSSPPLDGVSGEIMYSLRERGDPSAPRAPDAPPWEPDEALGYRDWGHAGDLEGLDGLDLSSPELAAAANPAMGIRISLEHIRREFRAMSREDFARERFGIWPRRVTGGSGVIADEVWRRQLDPSVADPDTADPARAVRPTDVVFVVQVNATRTHTTIAAVGARPDGTLLASIVDHRPGTHWAPRRLAELKRRHNPLFVVAQDKGPTGPLFTDLAELGIVPAEDRDRPKRGDLVVPWAADVAIAYGLFIDAVVDQGRLFHLDEAPLNVALAAAGTRALSGATAWDYANPSVAPLLAVTFGTWAVLTVKVPPPRRSAYEDDNELMVV